MQKRDLAFILILIIIIFGLYWKPLGYDLVWDTKIMVDQSLLFLEDQPVWSAFKYGYFHEQCGMGNMDFYYRPFLTASFLIEHKLWGLSSWTLRLTNLFIYVLSLFFLYIFLKRQSDKHHFAEMATAIFALYPLNVDNIMWVVGRGDLFLLLWGILSLLFLELSLRKRRPLFLACSSLFFLAGILSKESILFFLPVLFIYEWIKRKKVTVPYHGANIAITILFFVVKNVVLGIKNLGIIPIANVVENLTAPIAALGYYIRSMVFPFAYDMFLPLREAVTPFYLALGIIFSVLPFGPTALMSLVMNISPPTLILTAWALYLATSLFISSSDSSTGLSRYSVA